MATESPTTPRRALLSAAGFTGLAAVAAVGWVRPDTPAAAAPVQPTVSPDARLIALCAQFDELEHRRIKSHAEDPIDGIEPASSEAFRLKLTDRQRPLLRQIVTMRATTLEGAQARARMLHLWDAELEPDGDDEDGYWNQQMIWALVRDLMGAS